jgi:hypothetical protein
LVDYLAALKAALLAALSAVLSAALSAVLLEQRLVALRACSCLHHLWDEL